MQDSQQRDSDANTQSIKQVEKNNYITEHYTLWTKQNSHFLFGSCDRVGES